jgi:hypothetical protein
MGIRIPKSPFLTLRVPEPVPMITRSFQKQVHKESYPLYI